jgi:hypothetical protein
MTDNDFSIKPDFSGKSIVVEFSIERVIADWWLTELRGTQTVQRWTGNTNDNVADAVAIDARSLDASVNLGWLVVLFGPQNDIEISVTIDARQDGKLLGQKQQKVSLKAKQATQLAGTISFQ